MTMRLRDQGEITHVGTTDAQIEFMNVEANPVFVSREELEAQGVSPVMQGVLVSAMVNLGADSAAEVLPGEFAMMPQLEESDTLSSFAAE